MKFKNKKAAVFGCYGWSGESTKALKEHLESAGFEVMEEGLRIQWQPDEEQQLAAIEFGKKIVINQK